MSKSEYGCTELNEKILDAKDLVVLVLAFGNSLKRVIVILDEKINIGIFLMYPFFK